MTAPTYRWVRAHEWAQIAAAAGLGPEAAPVDVIAALGRRTAVKDAARAERDARAAAIRACRRCDPNGWRLGPDRTPVEPATRCDHQALAQPAVRDVTEPFHEPPAGRPR